MKKLFDKRDVFRVTSTVLPTQLAFTCSNQQSKHQKRVKSPHLNDVIYVVLVSLLLTFNRFHTLLKVRGKETRTLIKDIIQMQFFRSSHRRYSVRKGVLRNFAKFTGKHLCQSLFLNKVAGHLFYRTPPGDCLWFLNRYSPVGRIECKFRTKWIYIPFAFVINCENILKSDSQPSKKISFYLLQ